MQIIWGGFEVSDTRVPHMETTQPAKLAAKGSARVTSAAGVQ